jgi:hypothetical protein
VARSARRARSLPPAHDPAAPVADGQRAALVVRDSLRHRRDIENAYLDNLEAYDGEKVVITGEKQDNEYAEVNSKIASKKGEEFTVNYKLRQAGSDWKVYDVVIENISIVNNYRSQFNRVITRSSFEDLFRRMKDKQFKAAGVKQRPRFRFKSTIS